MRSPSRIVAAAFFTFVCFAPAFSSAAEPSTNLAEHPGIVAMNDEANRVREVAGLKVHPTLDEDCCRIAQAHANWMAANENMSHGGGEQIIAMGYATIPDAMNAWRNSGGHWSWLGGRSELCGYGYQRSASGRYFWAGAFRNRKAVK